MTLQDLGYTEWFEKQRDLQQLTSYEIGRIVSEHKERYVLRTAETELEAEIIGNLRFTAEKRADFPAVGDWVAFVPYDDDKALIHAVLKRNNVLERQSIGKEGDKQIACQHSATFVRIRRNVS